MGRQRRIDTETYHNTGKWTTVMKRCGKCNVGFNLLDGAILWLCPVCGEYGGEVASFARDDYPKRYVQGSSEYGLAII
jgi:hypothetical protein